MDKVVHLCGEVDEHGNKSTMIWNDVLTNITVTATSSCKFSNLILHQCFINELNDPGDEDKVTAVTVRGGLYEQLVEFYNCEIASASASALMIHNSGRAIIDRFMLFIIVILLKSSRGIEWVSTTNISARLYISSYS